jgi:long-chain acyl-CoA synthetase
MGTRINLVEALLRWEAERPDEAWLFQPIAGLWRRTSWAEAARQVRRMAAALKGLGYPPGSRICISGRNTAHWMMADLAIMMAGHVPVGLYPRQNPEITRYIFEHSQARAVFVGPETDVAALMAAVPAGVLTIGLPYPEVPATDAGWGELVARHEPLSDYTAPPPDALLTVIYTSGTSGMPKGVMLTHGNVDFVASSFLTHVMRPRRRERLLSYLPLAHCMERLLCEGVSLAVGAEVHFLERLDLMQETMARVAPTRFVGVPLVYARIRAGILSRIPQRTLDRLLGIPLVGSAVRRVLRRKIGLHRSLLNIVGAAPTPREEIDWFARLGIEVSQGYGPTEVSAYVSCSHRGANRSGAVGRILPGAEVRISEEGEILCRHPGLMTGYYRDPDATRAAVTADGYLQTGDKGHLDADGYLFIDGRIKDIFKTEKGKYVAPAAIESRLTLLPLIEACCVAGHGFAQPFALVTLSASDYERCRDRGERAATSVLLETHMTALNGGIERHAQLDFMVVVPDRWTPDNGFTTPTLKIRRSEIERHYGSRFKEWAGQKRAVIWLES